MELNLADMFESVADAIPERVAVVCGERRLRYADLEERANELANYLRSIGIGKDDHVGLYLYNGTEYLEAMLAAYKLRAVPININYRYVEAELAYLVDDAGLDVVICHGELASRVANVRRSSSKPRSCVVVDDGSVPDWPIDFVDYDVVLESCSAVRDFGPRSADDHYILYTGGTTGHPKGVVWRHEDIFLAAMSAGGVRVERAEEVADVARDGAANVLLPACPMMHASGQWGAFTTFFGGGTLVIPAQRTFDPVEVWTLVADERVNRLVFVGDAGGWPLADALAATPDKFDTSSLQVVGSGGSVLSPVLKARLLELLPSIIMAEAFGSSETGGQGVGVSVSGALSTPLRFTVDDATAVLDDDLQRVAPGSGVIGRIARCGRVPLGYLNDEARTAATFVEVDGERWALTGDMATVEADGTIGLLGRGSACINTGGEKVYPEEVESVLKEHPGVVDAVVVGVPDARWGEQVSAIVASKAGHTTTLAELDAHCRGRLASYKIPRQLFKVDSIERSPSGKPDYAWAKTVVAGGSSD